MKLLLKSTTIADEYILYLENKVKDLPFKIFFRKYFQAHLWVKH